MTPNSAIAVLSEKSVADRSRPVDFPDFTKGKWKTTPPIKLMGVWAPIIELGARTLTAIKNPAPFSTKTPSGSGQRRRKTASWGAVSRRSKWRRQTSRPSDEWPYASRVKERVPMKFLSASALLLVATAWPERAASDRALTFERDVRPVLKAHCFHCHGEGEKLKGDVDLRLRRFMADKQTDEGRVLTPGKPQASLMVKPMRAGEMPKGEKKVPEKDIALIEKWIMAGDRLVVHDGRIMSKKADASSESFRV